MSRNPYGSYLYQQSALLSQRVSEADPFFQDIALMDVDNRRRYAVIRAILDNQILEMDISRMSANELMEKIILPILQRVGQAGFKADPLTHLGMKVGKPKDSMEYDLE